MCEQDARMKLVEAIDHWGEVWGDAPEKEKSLALSKAIDDYRDSIAESSSAMTEKVAAMESLPWTANDKDKLRGVLERMSEALGVISRGIEDRRYRDAAAKAILDVTIEFLHAMVRGWLLLVSEEGGK